MMRNDIRNNKLYKRRYLGFVVESLDYLVSIANFLGTLATCLAIATFLGAPILAPFMAAGLMVMLAGLGIFLAINHYQNSKSIPKKADKISELEQDNLLLQNQLDRLKNEVKELLHNPAGLELDESDDDDKLKELLARLSETEQKQSKSAYERFFIVKIYNAVSECFHSLKIRHPRLIFSANIAINVGLGVFSGVGLVGTVAFIMGVSVLAMLATPLGVGVFALGCVAFIALNVGCYYFARHKLCSHLLGQSCQISALQAENKQLQSEIKQQIEFKNLILEEKSKQDKEPKSKSSQIHNVVAFLRGTNARQSNTADSQSSFVRNEFKVG